MYSGKETIYRDVHAFVDRLNDMLVVYGAPAIRTNLVKCLRGRANARYTTQLTPLEKEGLRNCDEISLWTNALVHKFKESATVALTRLNSVKYTISDARQKHEPTDYVYEIVRRAKAAGFDQTIQQLTYAYNGLEPELRALLDEPREDTTIDGFIDAIERKKYAWFDVYGRTTQRNPMDRRLPAPQNFNRRGYTPGPQYGYTSRSSYYPDTNRGFYRSTTPYRSNYDKSRPYQPSVYQQISARGTPDVQQTIENTSYPDTNRYQSRTPSNNVPYNPTPWNQQRRSDTPQGPNQTPGFQQQRRFNTPGQRETSGPPVKREDDPCRIPFRARAYHANNEEVHSQGQSNDDYDTSYDAYKQGFFEGQNAAYWTQQAVNEEVNESELSEDNIANYREHDSDGMEHTDAHVAMIKQISCRTCHTPFPSNNKLYDHLKTSSCLQVSAEKRSSILDDTCGRPHFRFEKPPNNVHTRPETLASDNITHKASSCLHSGFKPNDETTQQETTGSAATVVSSLADGLKGDGYCEESGSGSV